MTALAPHLTAFFGERLTLERRASVHTCDSYAYAFRLLLDYASMRLKTTPSRMEFEQIDAPLVVASSTISRRCAPTAPALATSD
jgi:integrase/recombinase XerD